MSFKTAIVGCGNIAGGYDKDVPVEWSATHAGAYHLCPDTDLVAVSDINSGSLEGFKKKWGVQKGYLDYQEMLKKEKIDILSICAPTPFHYEIFCSAIAQGTKAVYLEKPLSDNLSTAGKMVEAGSKMIVAVNYFRRWNTTFSDLADKIKANEYGKGIMATVHYNKGIFLNGSHFVDMMCWFWGEPVHAEYVRTAVNDPIDPGVDFILHFKNNFTVYFLNMPDVSYNFAQIDILMEKRRITIGQRGQMLYEYPIVKEPYYQQFDIVGQPLETETDWRNCTTRAVTELVRAVRKQRSVSCSLDDGLRVLKICHMIAGQQKRSMREK